MTNNGDEDPTVISSRIPTQTDKALQAFGTQLYIDSVGKLVDYGKAMITLVSGIFAVYFALLKFLGLESITSSSFQSLPSLWYAPVLFILTIIVFVVGVVLPFPQNVSLEVRNTIQSVRKRLMWVKYISCLIGTILFVTGLIFTMQIGISLLTQTPKN
jgi:hypothetical protein